MHTFEGKSCRIHYNADLSGDIVFSLLDSFGNWTTGLTIAADDLRSFISKVHYDRERERRDAWRQFMAAAFTNVAWEPGTEFDPVMCDCVTMADKALAAYEQRFPLEEPDKE